MQLKNYFFLLFILIVASCATNKPIKQQTIEKNSRVSSSTQRKFDYYFYEGLRLKDLQKYDQALEIFRLCLQIDSLDAGALSEAGLIYSALGLNNEAMRCMTLAVKQQPQNWWYSLQLITMFSNQKQWNAAIETANKIQQFYPNKENVYTILTSLYK